MAPAIEPALQRPDMLAQVMDELAEAICRIPRLSRMDLVPEVPGEERSAAAPSLDHETETGLDGLAGAAAEQELGRVSERPAVQSVVGMPVPTQPRPGCVERREQ